MKGLACYAVLLLVYVFTQVHGECFYKNRTLPVGTSYFDCAEHTCTEEGSVVSLPCSLYLCTETIGYRETDLSKPYPECCGGPICKD